MALGQQGVDGIDVGIADDEGPHDALHAEQHTGQEQDGQHAPFVETPAKQLLALAPGRYGIEIDVLQACEYASAAQYTEIRGGREPFVAPQQSDKVGGYDYEQAEYGEDAEGYHPDTAKQSGGELFAIVLNLRIVGEYGLHECLRYGV